MKPLVSICMPHLNSMPFTRERMDSIVQQTLGDWELIVVDSKSNDGSRELVNEYAAKDQRIRISEGPRDGIYTNLNRAIERASGEFVYVATSDDTMRSDCLERMVKALQAHPECGLAHCCLELIDENGAPSASDWEKWVAQQYFGDWIHQYHVRKAPHDGILHFGYYTVYSSLTQLLIRRSVFEEYGLFGTDCTPHSDFEWGMRVSLNENIVHIPLKLATWRRHQQQATTNETMLRARATGEFPRLVGKALDAFTPRNPSLAARLRRSELNQFYLADQFQGQREASKSAGAKVAVTAGFVTRHPMFSTQWMLHKLIHKNGFLDDFADAARREFDRLGLPSLLQRLDPC